MNTETTLLAFGVGFIGFMLFGAICALCDHIDRRRKRNRTGVYPVNSVLADAQTKMLFFEEVSREASDD